MRSGSLLLANALLDERVTSYVAKAGRMTMRRRGLWALTAVAIVGLVVTAASGQPPPLSVERLVSQSAGGSASISVAAVSNFGYQPDAIGNVPLDATITVTFTDDDVLPHTFNISSREGFKIPDDYTAAQLSQLFDQYHALYAAEVNYEGDVSIGNFTSPSAPGWYEFVCNQSGHFAEGMYGFIAFGEPVPSNLTEHGTGSEIPTTGSALVAATGGAVILAVLAIALIWRRRRSGQRPPPRPPQRS